MKSSGTVYIVCEFPPIWPPPASFQLFAQDTEHARVELWVFPDGHLVARIAEEERVTEHHFSRIKPIGRGLAITTLVWGGESSAVELCLNSRVVPPLRDHRRHRVELKQPKGEAPRAHPPVTCAAGVLATLTPLERLFLETLHDLESRIAGGKDYDFTRATALLRQLLLDKRPLVHAVNERYRVKLRFELAPPRGPLPPDIEEPLFHGVPLMPFPGGSVQHSLAEFLGREVLLSDRVRYSVADVIRTIAHVFGGVHNEKPTSEMEVGLGALAERLRFAGNAAPQAVLRDIARIALQGLLPLAAVIVAQATGAGEPKVEAGPSSGRDDNAAA